MDSRKRGCWRAGLPSSPPARVRASLHAGVGRGSEEACLVNELAMCEGRKRSAHYGPCYEWNGASSIQHLKRIERPPVCTWWTLAL